MRGLISLCAAAAAAALIACKNNEEPDLNIQLPITEANVTGTFALRSASGSAPPYNLPTNNGDIVTLLNDRIFIADDMTWADTINFRTERLVDGQVFFTSSATSGTYNIADGHINFTKVKGGTDKFIGSVVGNDLSVDFQGRLFLYTR